jgi:hypothetical protein
MNILPKIKRCPCCNAFSFLHVNGVVYKNSFTSLPEWTLKKIFNCRKCFVQLGLFYNSHHEIEKLVWLDFLKCEEIFYEKLIKLHETKEKNKENEKKYYKTLDEIRKINNQIHLSKVKLGIKFRLEHKGVWLKHSLN